MNKKSFVTIPFLTLMVSHPSYGSDNYMEQVFASESWQTINVDKLKPLNSFQWLERQGFEFKLNQRKALRKTFSRYDEDDLQSLLFTMSDSGVLAKCQQASQVNGVLKSLMSIKTTSEMVSQPRLHMEALTLLASSGALAKCRDGSDVARLIRSVDTSAHMGALAFLTWTKNSRATDGCKNVDEIITVYGQLTNSQFNLAQRHTQTLQHMTNMELFRHCGHLEHILDFFKFLRSQGHHKAFLWEWLDTTRALRVCQNLAQVQGMLQFLEAFTADKSSDRLKNLMHSDIFGLCQTVEHVQMFLSGMEQFLHRSDNYIYNLGKDLVQEFENIDQVFEFMHIYNHSDKKFKTAFTDWKNQLERMDVKARANLLNSLRAIKSLDADMRSELLPLLADRDDLRTLAVDDYFAALSSFIKFDENLRSIILKYIQVKPREEVTGENQNEIAALASVFQSYTNEERKIILALPFQYSHAGNRGRSAAMQRVDALRFFVNFGPEIRLPIITWLRDSFKQTMQYGRVSFQNLMGEFEFLNAKRSASSKGKEEANEKNDNWELSEKFKAEVISTEPAVRAALFEWMSLLGPMEDKRKANLLNFLRQLGNLDPSARNEIMLLLNDSVLLETIGETDFKGAFSFFSKADESQRRLILSYVQLRTAASEFNVTENSQLTSLIKDFHIFTNEERGIFLSLPFRHSYTFQKSSTPESQRLEALRFFAKIEPVLRAQMVSWLGRITAKNDSLYQRHDFNSLKSYFEFLTGETGDDRIESELQTWFKTSNWFAKSQDFKDLESLESLYEKPGGSLGKFVESCKTFSKSGLLDFELLRILFKRLHPGCPMYCFVTPLLNPEFPLCKSGEDPDIQSFYLLLLAAGHEDTRISQYFEEKLMDPQSRRGFLELVVRTLSEEHDLTQHFLLLGTGYVNLESDRGFLANHVHMLRKSKEEVVHNTRSTIPGCVLNVDMVTEPCPGTNIHMPVTVWQSLFDQLEKLPKDAYQNELQGTSLSTFSFLRTYEPLVRLLDPAGSVKAMERINSHSQMLRSILSRVQADVKEDPTNLGSFLQLVLNITSCDISKLNGITQSYLYLNRSKMLAECDLKSAVFRQDLMTYVKDELRRFREATMTNVIAKKFSDSPHCIYFARGVLGREIGIMFEGEVPRIDLNANTVNNSLLNQSKQQLLDAFYQYYKVDDVINRVRHMLNTGIDGANNLILDVICNFFGQKAMNEDSLTYNTAYVEVAENGKPRGFTDLAVRELLLILGVLKTQ